LGARYIVSRQEFVRDGTPEFSMLLPSNMERIDNGRYEGHSVEWQGKEQRVTSSYFLRETGGRSSVECELHAPAGKISVSRSMIENRLSIGALFDNVPGSKISSLMLWFSGADISKLCSSAATSLQTLKFLGDWTTLSLVSIAHDQKSFIYQDELGSKHVAEVGSFVTRDAGKVKAIHENFVEFVDLEESADPGGARWVEKTRRIYLTQR